MDCLKTRQDQNFTNKYLDKGKETRHLQLVSYQGGNKNINMHKIENIKIILLGPFNGLPIYRAAIVARNMLQYAFND